MRGISLHGALAMMAVALIVMTPAIGQMPEKAACSTTPLPHAFEQRADRTPLTASADAAGAQALSLAIGHGVDLMLHPAAQLHYAIPPNKTDEPGEYGGMLYFDIKDVGRYRVALGSGAWIDILAGSVSIVSIAHARGPECSGIRKMVDFQLMPGHYMLQISAGRAPIIPVMIARLPLDPIRQAPR